MQVELAQLRYLLPRLSGQGTSLSRLGGGIGSRGPGETKLETDRRRIRERIDYLEREIEGFARHQDQRRSRRSPTGLPSPVHRGLHERRQIDIAQCLNEQSGERGPTRL